MAYNKLMKELEQKHSNDKADINKKNKRSIKSFLGFVWVDDSYSVVAQSLSGELKTKGSGLRFFAPWWPKKEIIHVANESIDLPQQECTCKENYTIMVDPSVTYEIVDLKTFYHQRENAVSQLATDIISFFRKLTSNIDFDNLKGMHIEVDENFEFKSIIDKIRKECGINVLRINITDVKLIGELKKSKEENILADEANRRELKKAENNKKIAEIEAEAKRIAGQAEADVDAQKFKALVDVCATDKDYDALKIKLASNNEKANLFLTDNNNVEKIADIKVATSPKSSGFVKSISIKRAMNQNNNMKLDRKNTTKKIVARVVPKDIQNDIQSELSKTELSSEEKGRSK